MTKLFSNWSLRELETGNKKEKLLKRMLALISLKGGIPVYSLDEIPGLNFSKRRFESIGILLNDWEEEKDFVESNSGVLYAMTNYKRIGSGTMSKEELLACYWDYIIGPCMIEGAKNQGLKLEANYNLKSFLGTQFDVISDWVLIIKSIDIPVLFIEILPEFSTKEHYEKGLVKIYLEMTESCKRLAKEFIERGMNSKNIRVFGILIWRSEIQFCVAHPSIILTSKNSNEIGEISVNISGQGNKQWQFDTLEYKRGFYVADDYEKFMKMARKMMQDRIICKESLCKLKLIFKTCFTEIENVAIILGSSYSFPKRFQLPKKLNDLKIMKMNPEVYDSIPNYFKLFFPLILNDLNCEKLEEIHKNVCKTSLKKHLIEACTIAIHVLFELLILHEKAGYVHCNINCENIKFSPLLQIWKLCNFEQACKIEKSKKSVRIVGTSGFISPESNSSGVFTESSDVFALGKVLSRMFYLEMAYEVELCCGTVHESDIIMIDEFFDIICKMCKKHVKERISVRGALKEFYFLLKKSEIEGFFVYGTNLMFPLITKELK